MKSPIHQCNIHCHAIEVDKAELMGLDDKGKWLPFSFHMEIVIACKLTTDEEEESTFGCTTVFTEYGDTYIIDTPYKQFNKLYVDYNMPTIDFELDDEDDEDMDL